MSRFSAFAKHSAGVLIFAASLGLAASANAATNLTLIGGPIGGGWYLICGGLAEIVQSVYPEMSVRVVPGGGLVNPPRVSTGDVDIGMSLTVNTEMALKGADPYEEKYRNIRAIAFGFNPTVYQVVALSEVPVDTFEEIFTKKYPAKITTPGLQTMGGWTVKKLFEQYGATIDDLKEWGGAHYQGSHARSADLLRDGQADVLMTLLQIPAPNILQVSTVRKLKFLPMSQELMDKMSKKYGYGQTVIPKDAYKSTIPLEKDLPALVILSGLIVNKDASEDAVYKFTKALFENADRVRKIHKSMSGFVPEEIVKAKNRGSVKLHPGAERYFKEKGYKYQ